MSVRTDAHVPGAEWPVLLSESPGTPARTSAEAHAASCATCDAERAAAASLLTALAAPAPAPLLPPASARAQEMVVRELSLRGRALRVMALAATSAFAVLVVAAHHRAQGPAPALRAAMLLGLAGLLPWAVRRFGVSSFGLSLLALPLIVAPVTDFGLRGVLAGGHAGACVFSGVLGGVLPLAALLWLSLRRKAPIGGLDGAAAAAAGALAGQAALALTCPSTSGAHLLLFHALMVAILALLGALGARAAPTRA